MFKRVMLYTLACGDTEAFLYGINEGLTVIIDLDSRAAQLIALLRELAVSNEKWKSDQPGVLEVELLTF